MDSFLENRIINIFFSFKKNILISAENIKIIFDNKETFVPSFIRKNLYSVKIPIGYFLYRDFEVFIYDSREEIIIENGIEALVKDIDLRAKTYNIAFTNNNTYDINGYIIGSNLDNNDTVRISINGKYYRGTLINKHFFSINVLQRDLLLDNDFNISIFNKDGEKCFSKNFSYNLKKEKQKSFSYYFSVHIKQLVNGEVFLFKNYLQSYEYDENVPKEIINTLMYRSTIDGNIIYIISLYLNTYMDNIPGFFELIRKTAGLKDDCDFSSTDIRKVINTKRKVQDSIKMDIDLWDKTSEFLKKVNKYANIKYSRHMIINIFFTDYYQVYQENISKNILNLFDKRFNDNPIFFKRDKNNKFLSICEKHKYFLDYFTDKKD